MLERTRLRTHTPVGKCLRRSEGTGAVLPTRPTGSSRMWWRETLSGYSVPLVSVLVLRLSRLALYRGSIRNFIYYKHKQLNECYSETSCRQRVSRHEFVPTRSYPPGIPPPLFRTGYTCQPGWGCPSTWGGWATRVGMYEYTLDSVDTLVMWFYVPPTRRCFLWGPSRNLT
jgi:hypothetical protein